MAAIETVEIVVGKKDTLWDIVGRAGFPPRDWKKIYNAPFNKKFRSLRKDPHVIQPGDKFHLPKYNARDLAVIVNKIEKTVDRLQQVNTAYQELDKNIKAFEASLKNVSEVSSSEIAKLKKRADRLDTLATDAGNTCADMYSCVGGGMASNKFQRKSAAAAKAAKELEKSFKASAEKGQKKLNEVKKTLGELDKDRMSMTNEVWRLHKQWVGAMQKPY